MSMTRIEAMRHIQSQGYNNINDVPYNELPPVLREYATPRAPEGMQRPVARGPAEQAPAPTGGETNRRGQPTAGGDSLVARVGTAAAGAIDSAVEYGVDALRNSGPMALYTMARGSGLPVDTMIREAESAPADSRLASFGRAAQDTGTYGLLDTLAQGRAQAGALVTGASPEEAAEAGQAASRRVNENLEIARANYPGWAMAGDAAGFVAGGGPINAGYNLAFRSSRYGFRANVAAPAFTGGTEAALYRFNSGGTLEEVRRDASLGFALGAIGGAVFEGGAGILSRFRKSNESLRYEVGNEIYNAMAASARANGEELTPQQAAARLREAPPDAFITDMYPELTPLLRDVTRSQNPGVQDLTANFLRMRNAVEFNYRDGVLDVLRSGERPLRSETQFGRYIDERQAELSPRYDALLDSVEDQTVPVNDFRMQMFDRLLNKDLST